MHHLVYTSTVAFFTKEDLQGLLGRWRATNARLGVTGVLLYGEGQVLQVLEGEAGPVQKLFATIAADVRHRSVSKLADGPSPGRAFADWSMQFRAVDAAAFARVVRQLQGSPSHAHGLASLLEAFMAEQP
ncbi:BLUF domain-containing protein [Hymenobacter caeli]|uniref:BLUF domain-containing protein n=1 Tax=Hymenobacter caeli TaxID=2735894 RepID=A0ABX2FLF9_9BACT|nr:BLUF domain-containing protein [Hymenobacter caeli]NRT17421.1 hypothetical protein [Hymenobacter caeli]